MIVTLTHMPVTVANVAGIDTPTVTAEAIAARVPDFATLSTGGYSVDRISDVVDGYADIVVTTFENALLTRG